MPRPVKYWYVVCVYREHFPLNVFVMKRLGDSLSGVVCSSQSEGNVTSSRQGRLRFHGSLSWSASSAIRNDAQKHKFQHGRYLSLHK
jgi:hypothetical protein